MKEPLADQEIHPGLARVSPPSRPSRPVVVAYDNDEAGRAAAPGLVKMLRRGCVRAEVRHPPTEFKDVGEMPVEALTHWLAA